MPTPREIAEAFSAHRFAETYEHLAPAIRWTLVGADPIEGRDQVIAVCEDTLAELAHTTTEFRRFLVVGDGPAVAVDVVGHYVGADQSTSTVASCDIYEFEDGVVSTITSYTAELA